MVFSMTEGQMVITFDPITTLTLSILLLLAGYAIKRRVRFFERFCIPAPVISGLLFALLNFFLYVSQVASINLDTSYQNPFMIAFLTTVGLGASFGFVKQGGKLLIIYWVLSGILSISQNVIAVAVAKATGMEPMLGLMAGAIPLIGGHASAGSFGLTAQEMGFNGALSVAMAAATFGLIAGGLFGGPLAAKLMNKYNLKPSPEDLGASYSNMNGGGQNAGGKMEDEKTTGKAAEKATVQDYLKLIAILTTCMSVGVFLADVFSSSLNFVMPSYVGAMFVGVVVRNINDKVHLFKLEMERADLFGSVCLNIFLSYALMTLKIWELAAVAVPLLLILITEVAFILLFAYFLVFPLMGKNFDAAMMVAGILGHGLGATPNSMANMGAVTERYGFSRKAYMIVPIVGAFLVEIVSVPNNVFFMNLLR